MNEAQWQFELLALCVSDDGSAVWLSDAADGPALPQATQTGNGWWVFEAGAPVVIDALTACLAAPLVPLRIVQMTLDDEQKRGTIVYEVEALQTPGGRRWPLAAGRPPAVAAPHWALVTEIGAELAHAGVPPARVPWARRGWHAAAEAWLRAQAAAAGHVLTGVQSRRSWALGRVLTATTDAGATLYMKAPVATALFANEALAVAALAQLFPAYVPTPLAIDAERRWLLLPSAGQMAYEVLNDSTTPALRIGALQQHARVQVAAIAHVPALLAAGCTDRRWDVFRRHIVELCAADLTPFGVDAAQQAQLRALEHLLLARLDVLAAGPIPCSLLHGDLHFGNLAYQDGRFRAIDWTDAAVAFPWFDALLIHWARDPAQRIAARDAYLACWGDFATPDALLQLWEIATPLFFVYHAVSYRAILQALELGAHGDLGETLLELIADLLALDLASA